MSKTQQEKPVYRAIRPELWAGESMRQLRGDPYAQALALNLMTSDHGNWLGLYHYPTSYMAHDLGWSDDQVRSALEHVCDSGIAEYDHASEHVWVKSVAQVQLATPPLKPSDGRVPKLRRDLARYDKCALHARFVERYKNDLCLVGELPPSTGGRPRQGASGSSTKRKMRLDPPDVASFDAVTKSNYIPGPRVDRDAEPNWSAPWDAVAPDEAA